MLRLRRESQAGLFHRPGLLPKALRRADLADHVVQGNVADAVANNGGALAELGLERDVLRQLGDGTDYPGRLLGEVRPGDQLGVGAATLHGLVDDRNQLGGNVLGLPIAAPWAAGAVVTDRVVKKSFAIEDHHEALQPWHSPEQVPRRLRQILLHLGTARTHGAAPAATLAIGVFFVEPFRHGMVIVRGIIEIDVDAEAGGPVDQLVKALQASSWRPGVVDLGKHLIAAKLPRFSDVVQFGEHPGSNRYLFEISIEEDGVEALVRNAPQQAVAVDVRLRQVVDERAVRRNRMGDARTEQTRAFHVALLQIGTGGKPHHVLKVIDRPHRAAVIGAAEDDLLRINLHPIALRWLQADGQLG